MTETISNWAAIGHTLGAPYSDAPCAVTMRAHAERLAVELAPRVPALDATEVLTLVRFTCAGLPVTMSWSARVGSRIKSTRATVLVRRLHVGAGDPADDRAHVRYFGKQHTVLLSHVATVAAPELMTSYQCWNGFCIAGDCDAENHVDVTGHTWRQAEGDVYDPEIGEYRKPE